MIETEDLVVYMIEAFKATPRVKDTKSNHTLIIVLLIILIIIVGLILLLYVYKSKQPVLTDDMLYKIRMIDNIHNKQLYLNNQRNAMIDYPKNQESPKVEELNDEDFYKTVNNNIRKRIQYVYP